MDLTRIEQLWRAGRAGEAEAACRGRLATDPDDGRAAALLGVLLSDAGRHDEAIALLVRAAGRTGPDGDPGAACAWAAALGRAGRGGRVAAPGRAGEDVGGESAPRAGWLRGVAAAWNAISSQPRLQSCGNACFLADG